MILPEKKLSHCDSTDMPEPFIATLKQSFYLDPLENSNYLAKFVARKNHTPALW